MSDLTIRLSVGQMVSALGAVAALSGTVLYHAYNLGSAVTTTQSAIAAQARDIASLKQIVEDERKAREAAITAGLQTGTNNRLNLEQRLVEIDRQQQVQIDELKRRVDDVGREQIATARMLARIEATLDTLQRYLTQQPQPQSRRGAYMIPETLPAPDLQRTASK